MTQGEFWATITWWVHFFNGRVTSGPRGAAANKRIGHAAHSPHLVGLGADVAYETTPPPVAERAQWARRLGLTLVVEGDHDHLQPASWQPG